MDLFSSKLQLWFSKNKKKIVQDLFDFLKFKSIGTDPQYKKDTMECAQWVKNYLQKAHFKSELIKTPGFPIVYGELKSKKKKAKTLLIYGHYDVQPVDPIELWKSDPFEPHLVKDTFFARGAVDNKGQIFYVLALMKALSELEIDLDINIKFCIEGEEECGSISLSKVLQKEKKRFACDDLLIVDVGILGRNDPSITLGTRGILPFEIELTNASMDLHSGLHGGIAFNTNRALADLLSKLWDKNNHVCVPHFYEDVIKLSSEEKKSLYLDFDIEKYKEEFSIYATAVEKGFTPNESNWVRPSLELNGMWGGYCGVGMKTIIPAKAKAKLSCRLVPNQDPKKVGQVIQNFLQQHVEAGMKLSITFSAGTRAARGNIHSDLAKAASQAFRDVFKKPCKQIFSGASIPIASEMVEVLGCEMVLIGLSLSDDGVHAPNEHFDLDRFEKGFFVLSRIFTILGEEK